MINTLHFQSSRKRHTKNLLVPKVPCVVSLYYFIQENGCIIKEKTPTPFRNYRPSAKGLPLIDTFSDCTGEKPGSYLIPYFSGFCPAWTIRERALYKFRNGSCHVLISNDLAARGLDIPEVGHIIHYHLPVNEGSLR